MIDLLLPIENPYRVIESIGIISGLWLDSKFLWMILYQLKYSYNAGDDYWKYGKKYMIKKYNKSN
jgi:hypothetical protein